MIVALTLPAGQYEIFADEMAEKMIGNKFVAKVGDTAEGVGTILAAKVVDDGRAVELTIDWPKELPLRTGRIIWGDAS